MSDTQEDLEEEPPKKSKLPLILGVVLALAGGAGGFYASWSGLILSDKAKAPQKAEMSKEAMADIAYVEIDPLVISLGSASTARHLKFRAQLEVPTSAQSGVTNVLPRVVDVLNSYLRAVDPGDLENPAALARLRAQMLRRLQVVTGEGMVNDLLIMEFVLT